MNVITPEKPQVKYASIKADYPDRFARGWHCLGLERDFSNEIKKLHVFGTELVAYRGADSKIRVFDGHCPHMGADLSLGVVIENNLACPFHSWQWGDGGYCQSIPYCDSIPKKARIREWHTKTENDLLFIWHDHEELPPIDDQPIPRHRCCTEDGWSDWVVLTRKAESNCRELIDNLADVSHFSPVHGSPVSSFINVAHRHTYCQMLTGGNQLIGTGDTLSSTAYYYGPAYVIADMRGEMWGHKIESIMMIGSVPNTQHSFTMHFGMKVRRLPELSAIENDRLVDEYIKNGQETFYQDLRIWNTKKRVDNPILCEADGPVIKLREWYNQFYVDRDQVSERWNNKQLWVTRWRDDTPEFIFNEHGIPWAPDSAKIRHPVF